jgi:hypothetical protein
MVLSKICSVHHPSTTKTTPKKEVGKVARWRAKAASNKSLIRLEYRNLTARKYVTKLTPDGPDGADLVRLSLRARLPNTSK